MGLRVSELLPALLRGSSLELPGLAKSEDLNSPVFGVIGVIRGGMGICVRVRHEESGRDYALKTILPVSLEQEAAYRRFLEEIKIWITLSSNGGIVPAYCIERINEIPCVCTKWMHHGSLRSYLSVRSPQFFCETMDRIARTLAWAWTTYLVVHRDLKPDNILFNSRDWPHVADWGIARTVLAHRDSGEGRPPAGKAGPDAGLTSPGSFLGTLPYASPEQLIDARSADQRSDMYSLGCIMFEWETGTPPFFEGTPRDIAYAHLYKAPPRLAGWLKKSNFGADKVIAKCLEKRPEDRFQSYDELSGAIAEASRARKVRWNPVPIAQSPLMPKVGGDEFGDRVADDSTAVRSKDRRYAVISGKKYEPFLREAEALVGLGEWQKAANIYGRLFIPEWARSNPDLPYLQATAVNYGHCLIGLGKINEALQVFRTISPAKTKPAEFFVNYSNALNFAGNRAEAEAVAREGLRSFPSDKDILGNLTISLVAQARLPEAIETATHRLTLRRDIHSLEEAATVLRSLAKHEEDANWPEAFEVYKKALSLLEEAKGLNPRYLTTRYNLAQTWFDLGYFPRASKELAEFLQIPMHRSLLESCVGLRAQCLLWVSLFEKSVKFTEEWLLKFPGSVLLRRVRAEALVDGFVIGHVEGGVRIAEDSSLEFFESIVKDPAHRRPSDFCFLARVKDWIGLSNEALEILSEASALFPSYWEIFFCEADILRTNGKPAAAMRYAEDAVRKGKWHPPAWELLGAVYEALSMAPQAAAARQEGIRIQAERDKLKRGLTDGSGNGSPLSVADG